MKRKKKEPMFKYINYESYRNNIRFLGAPAVALKLTDEYGNAIMSVLSAYYRLMTLNKKRDELGRDLTDEEMELYAVSGIKKSADDTMSKFRSVISGSINSIIENIKQVELPDRMKEEAMLALIDVNHDNSKLELGEIIKNVFLTYSSIIFNIEGITKSVINDKPSEIINGINKEYTGLLFATLGLCHAYCQSGFLEALQISNNKELNRLAEEFGDNPDEALEVIKKDVIDILDELVVAVVSYNYEKYKKETEKILNMKNKN